MAEGLSKNLFEFKLNDDEQSVNYEQAVENSLRGPPLGYIVNSHDMDGFNWSNCRFKHDIELYNPLRDCLEHVFSKPSFCCGGSLKPENMEKLYLRVKPLPTEEDKDNWKDFKLNAIDIEELLKYCTPATFGDLKQMKTRVDSEVRLASAVETERFKIEQHFESGSRWFPLIPGGFESIDKHIEDVLTPGRRVKLSHYKLNVYGEGGFFKPHVDSPSADDMIGTLVLCLPSHHKGGELCVNHDGVQHWFDFSKHSGDTSRIQWAAFYSNCIHEVKPVLEGHRVTVTYNITVPRDSSYKTRWEENFVESQNMPVASFDEHFEVSGESPILTTKAVESVHSELLKIRADSSFTSKSIGFLLKHKYPTKGLQPHLLKGEDKALYDSLNGKQWRCKLLSVLSRYQTAIAIIDEDLELDESHQIFEFNPSKISSNKVGSSQRLRLYRLQWRVGIPFVDVYIRGDDGHYLVRNHKGQEEWVGNEMKGVGVDKIYVESALIIKL